MDYFILWVIIYYYHNLLHGTGVEVLSLGEEAVEAMENTVKGLEVEAWICDPGQVP